MKFGAFIPDDYFVLTAASKIGKSAVPFVCVEEPGEEKEAKRIKKVGESNNWAVTNVKETEAKRSPRPTLYYFDDAASGVDSSRVCSESDDGGGTEAV